MSSSSVSSSGSIVIPLGPEDRVGRDRRRRPTPLLCRQTILGGRRRLGRRLGEASSVFVDLHGPMLFTVALAIVALNVLDAWFTILLLSYGGQEMNPVVATVLTWGIGPFIACKSLGIGVCLGFLTLTKNFPISRIGMGTVLFGYLALVIWHLYLVSALGIV